MKRFRVSSKQQGMRLLAYLREMIPEASSVKFLKRVIDAKGCKVNGKVILFSTTLLKSGDTVEIDFSFAPQKVSTAPFPILYEDEGILICNKPPGIVCENKAINTHFPAYRGSLLLIHRLDKETSGALLIAKSEKSKKQMIELFKQLKVQKSYLALVDGVFKNEKGKVENFLSKKGEYQGQTLYGSSPTGQKAVTFWKCLKKGKNASLLLCLPVTGRTHQLRVHLKEMGHPILGDFQYGKQFKCSYQPARHLLHAYELRFTHPVTNQELHIKAPLLPDFEAAMNCLFPK